MEKLVFEYHSYYILFCIAIGIGYAYLLYSSKHRWTKSVQATLFTLRTCVATAMMVLLLGPIIKQIKNTFENPTIAFVIDNSQSMRKLIDTTKLIATFRQLDQQLSENDFNVTWNDLNGETDAIYFNRSSSDIATQINEIIRRYEGKNLMGIVLSSDGIYNHGLSPLYSSLPVPVYTLAVGDTVEHADVILKNIKYNRVVYQGNQFILRAEVAVVNLPNQEIIASVWQNGQIVKQQKKKTLNRNYFEFDFPLEATKLGIQRWQIRISVMPHEVNVSNNIGHAFVEVIGGKKRIVVVASAPHPDINALRQVVKKNSKYEFLLHIPGVTEIDPARLVPEKIDLLIAHQSPDLNHYTTAIISRLIQTKMAVLNIVCANTQLDGLSSAGVPIVIEQQGQRDEVQASLNTNFQDLGFTDYLKTSIGRYPPLSVPFGKYSYPGFSKVVLSQQIGSVITDRPLLIFIEKENQKIAIFFGEGLWKWRMNEFRETSKTDSFDELFSKIIQYLSTHNDRSKFRVFPIQSEFDVDEPTVFEYQVFNDVYEIIDGQQIDLELDDEQKKKTTYHLVTGHGASQYQIAGLKEGVYQFKASTILKEKQEVVKGQFLVISQNQESQNLTADFGLLRTLSKNSGGQFFTMENAGQIAPSLSNKKTKSIIHSEEVHHSIINLKIVFFILLLLISLEWFTRKYFGSSV